MRLRHERDANVECMSTTSNKTAIVNYADIEPEPWANGLGVTRVLASSGPDGGDFTWRLSLADLTSNCSFSSLPGIDRILTLATAGPIDLRINGADRRLFRGQQAPFTGEADTSVSLPAGPEIDFNLMVRRSVAEGRIDVRDRQERVTLDPAAGVVAALVLDGEARLRDGRSLAPLTAVLLGAGAEDVDASTAMLAVVYVHARS